MITDYGQRQTELNKMSTPRIRSIVSEYTGLLQSQPRQILLNQIRMMESHNYDSDGMLVCQACGADPVCPKCGAKRDAYDHNEY